MADEISNLQQLTFDGLPEVPCQLASYGIKHTQAPRKYPYIDGEGHDNTGRAAIPIQVRLLFLNTLTLEQPGVILFPAVFNQWQERALSGAPGNLQHPILGNIRARVDSFNVDLTSAVRSGVIVDATFLETLDEPEQQIPFVGPETSLAASAEAAQAACDAFKIYYPDGIIDGVSLTEAVRGVLGTLDSTATRIDGKIRQVQQGIVKMLEDAERLNDHQAYGAIDNLSTLWRGLQDLREHLPVQVQRAVQSAIAANDTTCDELALSVGNKLAEFIDLNPQLLADPQVLKGTPYRYYTGEADVSASFLRS